MNRKRHEHLIENPWSNFHFVYNVIKTHWLASRRELLQSTRGFDMLLAKVLKVRNKTTIGQRKLQSNDYKLSADEYIALSDYFNIPVERLVKAHRQDG